MTAAVEAFLTLAALLCDEPTILEAERLYAREFGVPSRPDLVAWIGFDRAVELTAYVQTIGTQITINDDEEVFEQISPALARVVGEFSEVDELWPLGRA